MGNAPALCVDLQAVVDAVLRLRDAGATRVKLEGVEAEFSPRPPPEAPRPKVRDKDAVLDDKLFPRRRGNPQ